MPIVVRFSMLICITAICTIPLLSGLTTVGRVLLLFSLQLTLHFVDDALDLLLLFELLSDLFHDLVNLPLTLLFEFFLDFIDNIIDVALRGCNIAIILRGLIGSIWRFSKRLIRFLYGVFGRFLLTLASVLFLVF